MRTLLALLTLASFSVRAATIAVIDSGLDTTHPVLQGNIWINPVDIENARDDDGNSYPDDIYGWNFAEQNNKVIDLKYQNTYTPDAFKYFEVQGRMLLGTASDADRAWMEAAKANQELIANLQKFGNFVHGTHVAGITVKGTANKALGIKLIPTEVTPFIVGLSKKASKTMSDDWRMTLLKQGLGQLAGQQMKLLEEIGLYVNFHKSDVANGSFGTGYKQAKMITDAAFKILFMRDATPAESDEVAKYFLGELISQGQKFVNAAPNTLFVFAAGNDGSDNDMYPTSPTNIKAANVISVAATYDVQFMASFSNYGAKMVDVGAPGMLINSTIPVNRSLEVSGTSQASPYVANVAGQIKAANPDLGPSEIKKIIMGTVDVKSYLQGKVVSGGIVNPDRAKVAAELSRTVALTEAISRSRNSVRDLPPSRTIVDHNVKVLPFPLTPMFK